MGNEYQRYLMHHGILGQKWGEKNGPPYPLKPNQRSAAERKAAGEDGEGSTILALAAFTATSVALLAAPSAIANAYQNRQIKNVLKEAENKSNDKRYASDRENEEIDPKTGLYLIGKKMTEEENVKRVNPSYDTGNIAFRVNCTCCTMAMELRERGYDVHAGTDGKSMIRLGGTYETERSRNWYIGESPYKNKKMYNTTKQEDIDAFKSDIAKEPDSRGELCLTWKCGGGHSVFYKTDSKGKLTIYDTQSGKKYSDTDLDNSIRNSSNIRYTRLDQSAPNIQYLKDNNYIC